MCFLPFPGRDYVCLYNITRIVDLAEVACPQSYDWHLTYHICLLSIGNKGYWFLHEPQQFSSLQTHHCNIILAKQVVVTFRWWIRRRDFKLHKSGIFNLKSDLQFRTLVLVWGFAHKQYVSLIKAHKSLCAVPISGCIKQVWSNLAEITRQRRM